MSTPAVSTPAVVTAAGAGVPPPSAEALRGAVDVWLLPEPAVDPLAGLLHAHAALTGEERARHDRLRHADARRRFLGARLLSRWALSRYADVPPHGWRFAAGPYGRPEIAGANRWALDVNVSHTEGLICCAVSRYRRTGVDTERWPSRPEAVRLAGKVLTGPEQARLAALDDAARRRVFGGYWVLKEAYTKALGLGLHRRFDSFAVADHPSGCLALRDPTLGPYAGTWQLTLLAVTPGHLVGLALPRGPAEPPVTVRARDAVRELAAAPPPGTGPPLRVTRLSGLTALALG